MMTPLTLCLTRVHSAHEQPCAVCGAEFVPAEDSGSPLLSLMPPVQEPFGVLMCAGVLATWSVGDVVNELVWIDRAGKRLGVVDRPEYYIGFRLSANQSCLAFARVNPGGAASDLWVLDLARGNPTRLGRARRWTPRRSGRLTSRG